MKNVTTTIDILSEDYPDKSLDQNQARCINMYLEPGQVRSKGKYKIVAYPRAGQGLLGDTGQANVRTMKEFNGTLYVVSGNKFGTMSSNGTFTQLGTNLNTSSGFAKIRFITGGNDNNNQVMIIDGTNNYAYNLYTSVATFPVSDEDAVQTATDMTSQDDYILTVSPDSIQYNLGNLADTTAWSALDFSSKTSFPDKLKGIESFKKRIFLHGNRSTEVVYNSGNTNFAFESVSDIFINYGLLSVEAKCICEDSYYFVGTNDSGGYSLYSCDTSFAPQPVSSFVQETIWDSYTTLTDCKLYTYKKDGHYFIDVVFPTENRTFTYDRTTNAWLTTQSGTSGRFNANCSAFCYNKVLTGDYNSGKIYYFSSSLYQDNGSNITRQIVTPPLYKDGKRIFINRLQIDVETGVGSNKTFTLEASKDSGRTWSTVDTYTVPSDNLSQIYVAGLGSSYDWVFRITTTMNAKFILLGMIANISIGTN